MSDGHWLVSGDAMNRRDFLRLLSLGTAATAAGLVLPEPERVRRFWAVPRNAPVKGASFDEMMGFVTDFSAANRGWVKLRSVFTYEAGESIPLGALVALGADGKAYAARSVADSSRPIIGQAVRLVGTETHGLTVDVPVPTVWTARA